MRHRLSIHRLVSIIAASAMAIGMVTGCGRTGSDSQSVRTGNALKPGGFTNLGTLTIGSASRGHVYGFALDMLNNATKAPLTFESARVENIPAGLKFVKMGLYYTKENNGATIIGGTDSDWDGSAESGTDYGKFPNHYGKPIIIKPRSEVEPSYYPVVFVRFESTQGKTLTMKDCTIFYKQGNTHYKQHQDCQFKITSQKLPG